MVDFASPFPVKRVDGANLIDPVDEGGTHVFEIPVGLSNESNNWVFQVTTNVDSRCDSSLDKQMSIT